MSVIPATWEAVSMLAQAKKSVRSYLTNKTDMVIYNCNPNYTGSKSRRILVPNQKGLGSHSSSGRALA
jgi:hypothetical protein